MNLAAGEVPVCRIMLVRSVLNILLLKCDLLLAFRVKLAMKLLHVSFVHDFNSN